MLEGGTPRILTKSRLPTEETSINSMLLTMEKRFLDGGRSVAVIRRGSRPRLPSGPPAYRRRGPAFPTIDSAKRSYKLLTMYLLIYAEAFYSSTASRGSMSQQGNVHHLRSRLVVIHVDPKAVEDFPKRAREFISVKIARSAIRRLEGLNEIPMRLRVK